MTDRGVSFPEPDDGTMLVLIPRTGDGPEVIWRDDIGAQAWWEGDTHDQHWWDDPDSDPMGWAEITKYATDIHLVNPEPIGRLT